MVSRNTFISHGREVKPDPPVQKRNVELLSVPEERPDFKNDQGDLPLPAPDEEDCELENELSEFLDGLDERIGRGGLTGAQLALLMMDWMTSHKVTDRAASSMWSILGACMAEGQDVPSFPAMKALFRRMKSSFVKRIEICPNDCIAYYNTTNLTGDLATRHAHRTKCPKCDTPRYVKDPKTNRDLPAKVIFHFPVASYIRALYKRAELVPHLWHDCGEHPKGHVAKSRGYRTKVTDNPIMNQDHRNIALVGTTDGVPFFDDQIRGAWPFFFRCANLPDALSTLPANIHLGMIAANEYYVMDEESGSLRRRVRNPKSLIPHLTVLVDDLLEAYNDGVTATDYSLPKSDDDYVFRCRAMLLYWTGDYPAQVSFPYL